MKTVSIGKLTTLGHSPLKLDVDKLVKTRMAVYASSGGGKTWALFTLLERTRGLLPQIILDREGDFVSLRRRHDYVLASPKGGDVLAHPSLAEALAKRCMEKRFSLIVDMYEMPELERQKYVRLFLEAIHDAPKKFWTPKLLVEDEAHEFAPESGSGTSEALHVNKAIAKKGRKRNIGFVVATQRPADLSKALTAECGNKMVGVCYQDHDRKRAAAELEFTTKEEIASLRRLEPGTFYAYGPALGYDIKLAVIDIPKDRPDEGGKGSAKPPAPSATLKGILSSLTELPKEAQLEAKTVADLQTQVRDLKRQLVTASKPAPKAGPVFQVADEKELKRIRAEAQKEIDKATNELDRRRIAQIKQAVGEMRDGVHKTLEAIIKKHSAPSESAQFVAVPVSKVASHPPVNKEIPKFIPAKRSDFIESTPAGETKRFGPTARLIAGFLSIRPDRSFTKIQIGMGSGRSHTSSGFKDALSQLHVAGVIDRSIRINLARAGEVLGALVVPGQNARQAWEQNLGKCALALLRTLEANPSQDFSREEICEATPPYQPASSGVKDSISKLNTMGLIIKENGRFRINPEVSEL